MLAGEGPDLLTQAGRDERAAVDGLVDHARDLIAEGGGRASATVLERVSETLHAAASDDELRAELEQGRVLRERKAAMFGGLMAAPGAPPPKRAKAGAAKKTSRGKADERTKADERAAEEERRRREEERERREQVKRGKAELRDLRAERRDAERAVTRAERELERVVARAQEEVEQAKKELQRAERAVADAERRLAELDGSG